MPNAANNLKRYSLKDLQNDYDELHDQNQELQRKLHTAEEGHTKIYEELIKTREERDKFMIEGVRSMNRVKRLEEQHKREPMLSDFLRVRVRQLRDEVDVLRKSLQDATSQSIRTMDYMVEELAARNHAFEISNGLWELAGKARNLMRSIENGSSIKVLSGEIKEWIRSYEAMDEKEIQGIKDPIRSIE